MTRQAATGRQHQYPPQYGYINPTRGHQSTMQPARTCNGREEWGCGRDHGQATRWSEQARTQAPCPKPTHFLAAAFQTDSRRNYGNHEMSWLSVQCIRLPLSELSRLTCPSVGRERLQTHAHDVARHGPTAIGYGTLALTRLSHHTTTRQRAFLDLCTRRGRSFVEDLKWPRGHPNTPKPSI